MRTTYLVGAGLGLVAAVVFASATIGPFFARFILMFITPLPIALAGLGWGWRSAVLAGAVGSALILLVSGPAVAAAFNRPRRENRRPSGSHAGRSLMPR